MVFIVLALLTFGLSFIATGEGTAVLLVFTAIAVMGQFIAAAVGYTEQVSDIENVKESEAIEKIYEEKAEKLTTEFARYLAEQYPQHEKEIFDKISPEKIDVYITKYPALKAAETISMLVRQINELQSDVYNQRIRRERLLKNIRSRPRNFWLYVPSLVPKN